MTGSHNQLRLFQYRTNIKKGAARFMTKLWKYFQINDFTWNAFFCVVTPCSLACGTYVLNLMGGSGRGSCPGADYTTLKRSSVSLFFSSLSSCSLLACLANFCCASSSTRRVLFTSDFTCSCSFRACCMLRDDSAITNHN